MILWIIIHWQRLIIIYQGFSEYLAKSLKLNPKFQIALDFQKKHQL